MKITKQPPKRNPSPPLPLQKVIKELEEAVIAKKPILLQEWHYPKGDLYHFVRLLNLMDAYYKHLFTDYFSINSSAEHLYDTKANSAVDSGKSSDAPPPVPPPSSTSSTSKSKSVIEAGDNKLDASKSYSQNKRFPDSVKTSLCSYLEFTRLLLDNSLNRHLYGSYEYINALLFSQDAHVVFFALRLLHRPASRLNNLQRSLKNIFKSNLNLDRLLELSIPSYPIGNASLETTAISDKYAVLGISGDNAELMNIKFLASAVYLYLVNSEENEIFSKDMSIVQGISKRFFGSTDIAERQETLIVSVIILVESIFQLKSKQSEVISQLNLHSNASVILFLLSKLVHNLIKEKSQNVNIKQKVDIIEAILSLISSIISTQGGANVITNNGIFVTLLEVIKCKNSRLVTKSISIVDSIIYTNSTFFTNTFCVTDIDGVDSLSFIIRELESFSKEVVDKFTSYENVIQSNDLFYEYHELILLCKSLMKLLLHVTQSYPGQDRVRNFVETDLIQLCSRVFKNQVLFQSQVHALAINIISCLIHNEPTCYPQIAEKHVPEVLLESLLNLDNLNSVDVISAFPNAIGAICLNASGLELTLEKFPFDIMFSLFSSSKHLRALFDDDLSSFLGPSFDELARHQPKLKVQIIDSAIKSLRKIIDLQNNKIEQSSLPPEVELMINTYMEDVKMVDKDTKSKLYDDMEPVLFFECIVRFFEGFFQHQPHCKDVIDHDPEFVSLLLKIFDSKYLSYDFASSAVSYSMSHIFRTLSDMEPKKVLEAIFTKFMDSYKRSQTFLKIESKESVILPFIDLPDSKKAEADAVFNEFKNLHGIVGLLSDVYSSPIFGNSKGVFYMVESFAKEGSSVISGLLDIYGWCAIESVGVRYGVPEKWITKKDSTNESKTTIDDNNQKKERLICDPDDPRIRNLKAWKYLLSQTTAFIVPLFQGLCKNMLPRRCEPNQNAFAVEISNNVVNSLVMLLSYKRIPNIIDHDYLQSIKKRLQYFHICSGLIHTFLTDERNTNNLLTVVADSFVKLALDPFLAIISTLIDECVELRNKKNELKEEDYKDIISRSNRTLDGFLNVLLLLIDENALNESSHTTYFISSFNGNTEKKGEKFRSKKYMISVQCRVIENILEWIRSNDSVTQSRIYKIGDSPLSFFLRIVFMFLKVDTSLTSADVHEMDFQDRMDSDLSGEGSSSQPEVNEHRVTILQDMGFTSEQARGALRGNQNSVMRAAEFLLTHPDYQPEPEIERNTAAATTAEEDTNMEVVSDDGDDDYEDVEDAEIQNAENKVESTDNSSQISPLKKFAELKCSLENLILENMSILSRSAEVVFEVKDLVVLLFKKSKSDESFFIKRMHLDELFKSLVNAQTVEDIYVISPTLHLLAILCHDPTIQVPVLRSLENYMDHFVECTAKFSLSTKPDDNIWISSILLILEAYFTVSSQPSATVKDDLTGEILLEKERLKSLDFNDHYKKLICSCLKLMQNHPSATVLRQSILQILMRLTRNAKLSVTFVENSGIKILFDAASTCMFPPIEQSLCLIILRHVIEEDSYLSLAMEKEIITYFSLPKDRVSDVTSYLKSLAHICLRNPELFVTATANTVKILRDPRARNPSIELKKSETNDIQRIFNDLEVKVSEAVLCRQVIYGAVDHLWKYVENHPKSPLDKKEPNIQEHFDKCIILQGLSDIFLVYPPTKSLLLNYRKNENGLEKLVTYILKYILPNEILLKKNAKGSKERTNEHNWAMFFMGILCSSNIIKFKGETKEVCKEESLEVITNKICAVVIGCMAKIMRENADGTLDKGTVVSIAELLQKILTTPSNFNRTELNISVDSPLFCARLLLDEGFTSLLTKIMKKLDHSSDEDKLIFNSIIKPYEALTKIGNTINEKSLIVKPENKKSLVDEVKRNINSPHMVQSENFIKDSVLGMFSPGVDEMDTDSETESSDEDEDEHDMSDIDHGAEPTDFTDMSDDDGMHSSSSDNENHSEDGDMDIVVRTVPMENDQSYDDNENENEISDEDDLSESPEWVFEFHGHEEDDDEDDDDRITDEENDDDHSDMDDTLNIEEMEEHFDNIEEDAMEGVEGYEFDQENDEENSDEDDEDDEDEHAIEITEAIEPVEIERNGFISVGNAMGFIGGSRNSHARRIRRNNINIVRAEDLFSDEVANGISPPILLNDFVESPDLVWRSNTNNTQSVETSANPLLDRNQWRLGIANVEQPRPSRTRPVTLFGSDSNNALHGNALHLLEQLFNINTHNVRIDRLEVDPMSRSNNQDPSAQAALGTEFFPIRASDRWIQEAKILFGTKYADKASTIRIALLNTMRPAALEEEEKEKARKEKEKAEAEAEALEKEKEKLEKAKADQEVQEEVQKPEEDDSKNEMQTTETESAQAPVPPIQPETQSSQSSSTDNAQTIVINGVSVDLSNTGIDLAFLEALPDDLRAEVLAQHLREQGDLTMASAFPGEISADFLSALPPEMREEIVQLREMEQHGIGGTSLQRNRTTIPPNDLMAVFEQSIQQVMESVGGRGNSEIPQVVVTNSGMSGKQPENKDTTSADTKPMEPAEVVEIGDIPLLIGLILINVHLSKSTVTQLLLNIIENGKIRAEILGILLSIIQEMINVEKNSGTPAKAKPKNATPRKSQIQQTITLILSSGNSASLIVQRCLDIILDMVSRSSTVADFFLSEHESIAIRSRKGKAKVKPTTSRYPLVILMSLLEIPFFYKNVILMDSLTLLISLITKPLPLAAIGK